MQSCLSVVRSKVYKSFFGMENPVSTQWGYNSILERIPNGSTILDVGCGDGIYFTNMEVLQKITSKRLKITCIDIDAGALKICKRRIKDAEIENFVSATAISLLEVYERYDFILFMESFPVIPLELFRKLFKHAMKLANIKVMMYHNLSRDQGVLLRLKRIMKPLIYYFTLVDFGRLTTLEEMEAIVKRLTKSDMIIEPLLRCRWSEMHFLAGWLEPFVNLFPCLKISSDIVQYLVTVNIGPSVSG